VREERIGWVVLPGDTGGLKAAIMEAESDRDRLNEMGLRARSVAESKYSFGPVSKAYKELVASLLEKGS